MEPRKEKNHQLKSKTIHIYYVLTDATLHIPQDNRKQRLPVMFTAKEEEKVFGVKVLFRLTHKLKQEQERKH